MTVNRECFKISPLFKHFYDAFIKMLHLVSKPPPSYKPKLPSSSIQEAPPPLPERRKDSVVLNPKQPSTQVKSSNRKLGKVFER